MKLKLTLTGASTPTGSVDVEIDAPGELEVGDLAAEVARRSPHHQVAAISFAIRRGDIATPIDPALRLQDAGLVSGATVDLVPPGMEPVTRRSDAAVAVMTITSGPDLGRRFPLGAGSNLVGRDPACDVLLADELVSRQHLRVEVADPVEVVDLGSANGTIVHGARVPRARIEPTTEVLVGDTAFRVEIVGDLAAAGGGAFVRSPPAPVHFVPVELRAPTVPTSTKAGRIPVIAALAPLVLGAAMFAITRQPASLIFIALSPIMLIGNAAESRLSHRRGRRRSTEQYHRDLADFAATAQRALDEEAAARRAAHPDLPDLVRSLRARTPTLWSRRPDDDHFAELCLGRGTRPAMTSVTVPPPGDAPAELVDARQADVDACATVDDVPVVVDLAEDRSVGIAGPPERARPVAASIVASAVLLHSPAELSVALISSESAAAHWEWLKWLPHVDAAYSALDGRHLATTAASCVALHGALTQLRTARSRATVGQQPVRHLPHVLLVIEDDAPIDRSLLVELLEQGPAAGIHTIWVAGSIERLPAGCGAVVDASGGSDDLSVRIRRTKERTDGVWATMLSPDDLDDVARSLSPVVDVGARTRGDSGLPDIVPGPPLLGLASSPAPELLLERWSQTAITATRDHDSGLRAAVGVSGGEPLVLDLRTHGPHALVGGTTGAGKSEFLQAWVMGLATSYGPQRVNFLFVDYKGGSAFSECVKLPHCVGLVTDLSPHLVERALTSLRAELHRREQLFGALDAKDIHELERRGAPETPPALIIVVDEFAALVQEVPEFVNGVVNVAQRGRSLGLHLVLATQRPAGVITGNLRANTNLRIALRMADESDSADVIDAGDAAFIDAAHPGRGVAKIGPGRTFEFQSAFYGGWSSRVSADQQVTVRPLSIDGGTSWPARPAGPTGADEPNDLARLVAAIQRAALVGHQGTPRRPWLPELPTDLDLRDAPLTRSDAEIVFGTRDVPAEQAQPPIAFTPDRDGNLAVFGASGSGKSTLLRTLAMVAGSSSNDLPSDGPCHVYGIDFGSRSLQLLDEFPHVGAVITADDHERITRLVRELRARIDERQQRYRSVDADTIADYRRLTGDGSEPRVLLLIDNFGAFRQAYDVPDRAATLDALVSIMADGRSVGIHVVVAADRPGAIPSAVMSLIPRRLVLRLATDSDYLLVGEPADVLAGDSPPGRGVEDGREFQVAVLGGTANLAEQTRLARALAQHDGFLGALEPAPPVRRLPSLVRLADLPVAVDDRPTLGVDDATLAPVGFDPFGAFVVAGPPGSGRTTAIGTMAASLARWNPTCQRVLFAQRRSPLRTLVNWTSVAERPAEHATLAAAITADLEQLDGEVSGLAIFIEQTVEALEAPDAEAPLLALVKAALAADALVVVEGEPAQLVRAWKLDAVKNQRTGLLLQPQATDGEILKAQLGRVAGDQFPTGRGFRIARREIGKLQVAVADPEGA